MHTPPWVLIVDDKSVNVHILSTRLTVEGYKVLTATDGVEAIAIARTHEPDLILLDVIMPPPDGFEVCRRLKSDSTLPFIPILMITAKAEPQDIVAGLNTGADDYLTKPIDPTVLMARVGALLRLKARHDAVYDEAKQFEQRVVQLEAWNLEVKDQLQDHITQLERMGYLRRFLSSEVIEGIGTLGDEDSGIVGRKNITVLSCVLHGFEAFIERTLPKIVFEVLGDYHRTLEPLMDEFDGILEQFTGAEFQVIFDVGFCHNPMDQAVQMALSIHQRLELQREREGSRLNDLEVGIGVACGEVTFGLMEFGSRLDYAVMGTVRHLASRLGKESQGGEVLVNQSVWEEVEKRYHTLPAGKLVLKSHVAPIPFFEIREEREYPV